MEVDEIQEDTTAGPCPKKSKSEEELLDLDQSYTNRMEAEPFSCGAEALLTRCTYLGKKAIFKQRVNKAYRHPELDKKLIKERIKAEIRGIDKCKKVRDSYISLFLIYGF